MSQQLQLSQQQIFGIAELVLKEAQVWAQKKMNEEPNGNAKKTKDAVSSLLHSRLLVNLFYRDLLMKVAKKHVPPPLPPLDSRDIDTTSTQRLFSPAVSQPASQLVTQPYRP